MGLRKLLALGAMAAMMVAAFGTAAMATEDTDAVSGEVVLEGAGWLYARGTGEAILNMGGGVRMYLDGDIKIEDHAGDLQVWIDGVVASMTGADVELEGFQGRIRVRGSDFTLKAEGAMEFVAHGHGVAKLEGSGVYRTRHSRLHPWDPPATD